MTTAAKVDEVLAHFDRKSPRDSYRQVCDELEVHTQRTVCAMLPDAPQAWHRVTTLDLDRLVLGSKGCMALLPIVTVSTVLRRLSMRQCGVSDEFVRALCEVLQGHPSMRSVDVSDNALVTVYSASPIISVMRNNSNMVSFAVAGTHVGTNVAHIIDALGERNRRNVATYYEDKYFKMKDLFGYLDENGQGWVQLKSLLLNCPYPVLQEQFAERIALKRPRRRSDGAISLNTFLELIYMNYKTELEIARQAEAAVDEPYVFMIANWKQLLAAVARHNSGDGGDNDDDKKEAVKKDGAAVAQPLALPDDLHRIRLRDFLLTNAQADAIIAEAAAAAAHDEHDDGEQPSRSGSDAATAGVRVLPASALLHASRTAVQAPPSNKPLYRFFQERDAAYIPACVRNGSRVFDLNDLSMLNSSTTSNADSNDDVDAGGCVHTFALPAMLVRMIVDYFNSEVRKQPKKKESVVPDSPRTRKDKAMIKAAVDIRAFLSAEFVTDFEKVRPSLLADYYARYALPIDDCTITLQEMVNVLDELYVVCRIDTPIARDTIVAMDNPLADAKYAEFFMQHLIDRDEDTSIVQRKRYSYEM